MIFSILVYVLVFFIGLVFGSFMNVVIYRAPRGKSIVTPASACPNCGYVIPWYLNIPVLSYLFLGGKCAGCKTKISCVYPIVEIITAILFLAVFIRFGYTIESIKYMIFTFLLLSAGFTDFFTALDKDNFETGVIPDGITIGGAMVGFIFSFFTEPGFVMSLAGAGAGLYFLLIVSYLFEKIRGIEGMGGGDLKLFGMIGAFLGPSSIIIIVTLSALFGAIVGGIIVAKTKNRNSIFPYGPMIAVAGILYIFTGDIIRAFFGI